MNISLSHKQLLIIPLVALPLFVSNALHADTFLKSMTVATVIDKNQFYTPNINIYFKEPQLHVEMNTSTGRLRDATTDLIVEASGIGVDESFALNHVLYLTKNETTCYKYESYAGGGANPEVVITEAEADYPNYKSEFVTPYLDGTEFTKAVPLGAYPFNQSYPNETSKRYASYPFTLKFLKEPLEDNTLKCEGEIQVMVEFSA